MRATRNGITGRALTALALAIALAGCVAAPPAPRTPTELVGWADATNAAIARSTTEALQRGAITPGYAQRVHTVLERADASVDTARVLIRNDRRDRAELELETVRALLLKLERALAEEVEADG